MLYYIVPKNTYMGRSSECIDKCVKQNSCIAMQDNGLILVKLYCNEEGILYGLVYDNLKDMEESEIGNFMVEFEQSMLKTDNIFLSVYTGTLEMFVLGERALPKNTIILKESVLFRNMTLDEKKSTLNEYIQNIDPKDKHLLIIDPYLLAETKDPEYPQLLKYLLNNAKFSKLDIITSERRLDESLREDVLSGLNASIKFSDDFHDRFWISDYTKGIVMGTSLNGIGNRICLINKLTPEEVRDIVSYVTGEDES